MALTDTEVRNAKPKERPYKLYDEKGLYLIVTPKGGKWWRFNYRFQGKQKTLSLGTYPEVTLKEAREKRDELRKKIANKEDPSIARKSSSVMLFGDLAWDWYESRKASWTPNHAETVVGRLKNYIIPAFGKKPLSSINTPEVFQFLKQLQAEGKIETAHRVKQIISMIFRYAIVNGSASYDPTSSLGRGMLISPRANHYPTLLEPEKIGGLMRAIDGYESIIVRYALKLLALTFLRPGELRHGRWEEVDLEEAIWEIPAERMKLKKPHLVPLSRQAIQAFSNLKLFTGDSSYVFPSTRDRNRPISDMTLNAALRRMGFSTKEEITSHGFRAMARTILHERLGYSPDVIELQLAHAVPDRLGEAYNRTKFLEERKRMMQDWADYLDSVKNSSQEIPS